MNWPRISIIVPSFNQGGYIEETLRSVLDQDYPAVEIIVMDAGSTDGTLDILRRYHDRIVYWESTPDRGQSHAINKGLAKCIGDVWLYLNSDDLLSPGSLAHIGELFRDPAVDWVGGGAIIFDQNGIRGVVEPKEPASMREVLTPWKRSVEHVFPCSNVCFMRRSIYERIGGFDESYHYSMDMEYYTRALLAGFSLQRITEHLGRWRWHEQSKTVTSGCAFHFLGEELRIARAYMGRLPIEQRTGLDAEIEAHTRWFLVRRALNESADGSRYQQLRRLLSDAAQTPSLLTFRPWWGGIRRQFSCK